MSAPERREPNERAREGGGAAPGPLDHPGRGSAEPPAVEPGGPIGSESSVVNRRDIPGGSFRPARTPGALGPTSRDVERAVSHDANASPAGRTEVAGELQEKPKALAP